MYQQIDSNKRKSILLMTLFILVIVGLGWAWSIYSQDGYIMIFFALALAIIMSLTSFFGGDKIALAQAGAKAIKKNDNPYVWRMIENLSITAGIPMPKVYIINDPAMNAFATGRDPEHSSIALTTGIINGLENQELEGVIAHELSHVKNYDIRLMMIVIVCVGVITLLADWMLRSFFWRGRKGNDNKGNGILLIVGLVLAVLSPLFAKLIQLAVSRKREFLADASGALLTRYPEGLATALEKISKQNTPLKNANKATAHLYISSPFKGKKKQNKFFSTHPPIQERVSALRKM
ncbi:M48 family metallopeptidase [Candidatus Parcubacteria bacterium]|mgnify:CR=1 FL=1|jgi:heat shock protein HtpX|nr:M48 family metallopeptidase [Candidatus Parcubacteria bacterium]MBT7228877.1 M48 family metallopeptidase [Candidatus Parcubacteria bacterium]